MTSRERIMCALSHQESDRVAIHDTVWDTTVKRWHQEGLPEERTPAEYFDYEIYGVAPDTTFQLPQETVEETDEYITIKNADGTIIRNWKNRTSTPEMIAFTITDRKIWEELKPRFAMNDSRVDWEKMRVEYEKARAQGKFITFNSAMGYDRTQGFVGSEKLLMAMIEDPEWVKDMFDTEIQLLIDVAEEMMAKGFQFDGAFLFDDMGYRNASLFSPAMYRELLFPAHKRIFGFFRSQGLKTILHSCGRVEALIPGLVEAGLSCLQPLEVKAGMDLIKLKQKYSGQLAFMGGIDVRKMKIEDSSVIESEMREKITYAKQGGGYIYHSDHSVPDDISFAQYQRVIKLAREYGKY